MLWLEKKIDLHYKAGFSSFSSTTIFKDGCLLAIRSRTAFRMREEE